MKRFIIRTLGCKVNQCESAAISHSLTQAGCHEVAQDEKVDLFIVNTCTVTSRAAMQSRQIIRQALRQYPGARIVVTGCYAQVGAEEIADIAGVDLIVGHEDKLAIDNWLPLLESTDTWPLDLTTPFGASPQFAPLASAAAEHRTRAFLKVQDGCNTRCNYCIVPIARGPSRSMPVADVIGHLDRLKNQNFQEVVLTGIHLGAYGLDLTPPSGLADLVKTILNKEAIRRLRLSSIEPTEIDQRLIDLMRHSKGAICRHWHIPLQSGDDGILERMGRPYNRDLFARTVETIHTLLPDAAIGVDILAGLPGEDDHAYANTVNLIRDLPVSYLHVFPYSPRPGTKAAGFKDRIPSYIVKERCRELRALGEEKRRQFYKSQIGTLTTVLVESLQDKHTGDPKGTSDNYLPVLIPNAKVKENDLVTVRIRKSASGNMLIGDVIQP